MPIAKRAINWRIDPTTIKRKEPNRMTTEAPANPDQAVNPTPVSPPDMATLTANLTAAKARLTDAQAKLAEATARNDIPGILQASAIVNEYFTFKDGVMSPAVSTPITRAEKALERAGFEARAGERNAAAETLKGIGASLTAAIDVKEMVGLAITGFTVVFAEDGTATVNVTTKAFPKGGDGATKGPRTATVGGGKVQWHYNGGVLTGRELIDLYGDDEDKARIAKADNWKEDGLKFFPGIDSTVKRVAKRIGATGEKSGVAVDLG